MAIAFLQAPKVSKEGHDEALASVALLLLWLLPLFPCIHDECVLQACSHLHRECQTCAFTHLSFLPSAVIQPVIKLLSSS